MKSILTVMVSDMKQSLQFYCETLGMKPCPRYKDEWAEVEADGFRIGLHPGGKLPLKPHSRHYSIGLQVDDLDKAMKGLKERGVKFTDAPEDRGVRLAYFNDPDGNPLYLIEVKWG